MYFDALTLNAITEELQDTILGGRIQKVVLPSPLSIALEIYVTGQRRYLLLSAHPQFTRAHLSIAKPSRGVERDTPLLLLLRKYVVGGRITAIEQPELERVLVLSIVKGSHTRNITDTDLLDTEDRDSDPAPFSDDFDAIDDMEDDENAIRCELIVELMERRGNIILVNNDNIILQSIRHVTPRMSRRPVQPREPYELPPRQDKRDPRRATPDGMRDLLNSNAPDLVRALVNTYRGLSPLAAREAVFRATGRSDTPITPDLPWAQLALAVRAIWNEDWQPCIVGNAQEPQAYAPYMLTHLNNARPAASISAILETFYQASEQLTSHQQRRDATRQQLNETRSRFDRQRQSLANELQRASELDMLRWEGEMIYAFLHTLKPRQSTLVVEDRTITLDPMLSPIENAQERFRAYDKAKAARTGVPERLQHVEAQLAGVDEMLALLDLAEGFEQIESIAREAVELGYIRPATHGRSPKTRQRQAPLRITSSDGFAISIGRTAWQNEQVTFKIGAPDDLWLHVHGMPGAHVIIKSGGHDVPDRTLREAAGFAAYFSNARAEPGVDVDIARRRLVRHIPNGPIGLVTYQAEYTIRVAPYAPPTLKPSEADKPAR